MLLWPPRRRADLEREAVRTLRAVADFLCADREQFAERRRPAREAVDGLGRRFLGTRHRPSGPSGPTAALASLPDELDWLLSSLTPSVESPALELVCTDAEAVAAADQMRQQISIKPRVQFPTTGVRDVAHRGRVCRAVAVHRDSRQLRLERDHRARGRLRPRSRRDRRGAPETTGDLHASKRTKKKLAWAPWRTGTLPP
jgi:hypothetical protein